MLRVETATDPQGGALMLRHFLEGGCLQEDPIMIGGMIPNNRVTGDHRHEVRG